MATRGQAVVDVINQALQEWCGNKLDTVTYINKGMNALSDTHSALQADCIDTADVFSAFNSELMAKLGSAEKVWLYTYILVCIFIIVSNNYLYAFS